MKLVFFNKIESCNLKLKRSIKKFQKKRNRESKTAGLWFFV